MGGSHALFGGWGKNDGNIDEALEIIIERKKYYNSYKNLRF